MPGYLIVSRDLGIGTKKPYKFEKQHHAEEPQVVFLNQ